MGVLGSVSVAEIFQTCHAEQRASPGEAGISASRSIPKICPLPCSFREFSSMRFYLELFAAANDPVSVELPGAARSRRYSRDGSTRPNDRKEAVIFKLQHYLALAK